MIKWKHRHEYNESNCATQDVLAESLASNSSIHFQGYSLRKNYVSEQRWESQRLPRCWTMELSCQKCWNAAKESCKNPEQPDLRPVESPVKNSDLLRFHCHQIHNTKQTNNTEQMMVDYQQLACSSGCVHRTIIWYKHNWHLSCEQGCNKLVCAFVFWLRLMTQE